MRVRESNIKIKIIACGDTGQAIGEEVIKVLEALGINIEKSLLINSGVSINENGVFNEQVTLTETNEGFARDLEEANRVIKKSEEKLETALSSLVQEEKELLLVFTGSGGTGISSTLFTLRFLSDEFNLHPPVFTLLPNIHENSRTQFNSAQFLYEVVLSKNSIGNSVILLDNKPTPSELKASVEEVASSRILKIPQAISQLIHSSYSKSSYDAGNAVYADLDEVLHLKGIGVLVTDILEKSNSEIHTRFEDILIDNVIDNTGLLKEDVYKSRKIYCALNDISTTGVQFAVEIRKLVAAFNEKNELYLKIYNSAEKKTISLNAIVKGIPLPPRVVQILKIARDARKDIIFKENCLQTEKFSLDMNKVYELENLVEEIGKV